MTETPQSYGLATQMELAPNALGKAYCLEVVRRLLDSSANLIYVAPTLTARTSSRTNLLTLPPPHHFNRPARAVIVAMAVLNSGLSPYTMSLRNAA